MIKTLRLTGVVAVAFAALVLVSILGPASPIHFAGKGDHRMDEVLASPSAVERFHDLHGDKGPNQQDTTPPLVKQAEAFKDIIDPKLPPAPIAQAAPTPRRAEGPKPPKPQESTAKFTLVGTSYSSSNPRSSFAYVRLLDNTCQWVQCGSEVGHLVIKEVRENSIIFWDGHRDSEMMMEATLDRAGALEVADADSASASTAPAESQPAQVKVMEMPTGRPGFPRPVAPPTRSVPSRMNDEEHKALNDVVARLKELQALQGGGAISDADRIAATNKLMAEFKSSQVSPQESRRLENLGDEVNIPGQTKEEQNRELMKRLKALHSAGN